MALPAIAFLGFGEAGQALAEGLRAEGVPAIAAWDILFPLDGGKPLREAAARLGVRIAADAAHAVRGADVVFSAVTADSNLTAAEAAVPGLAPGQFFVDLNSVSPARKRRAAAIVGAGVRFVGMAVMAPIHPLRHKTPVLVSGPGCPDIVPLLRACGMEVDQVGPDAGAATAIKMVRSVMIKGMEALMQECLLAARRAGVEERLLATLAHTFPALDWAAMADYNMERMAIHGLRRAAEMREVCATLEELGVDPTMTRGTVEREQRTGEARLKEKFGGRVPHDYGLILDALLGERPEGRV